MFDPLVVLGVVVLYVGGLFAIATLVERKYGNDQAATLPPWVYALSLAVYCTAWTFYGSVGKAVHSGPIFITIYLGPTLAFFFGSMIIKRFIRVKREFHITSIADLISVRYNRSTTIGILATLLSVLAILPYLALQIKAIDSTYQILTTGSATSSGGHFGLISSGMMIIFTILLGVRRLDPTERHPGIVAAITTESLIKLSTFLILGAWLTWGIFDGFSDISARYQDFAAWLPGQLYPSNNPSSFTWVVYIMLAMSAILFLPRQFHITVVENVKIKDVNTATWMFPLYLFLLNLFVIPVALGGQMLGLPIDRADDFVILLPALFDQPILAMMIYIGGFSAASGMVIVSTMTLATMVSNHLFMPLVEVSPRLSWLRKHVLPVRWISVTAIIAASYVFYKLLGHHFTLVSLGMMAFVAALQFAPAAIGGLFWTRGTKRGAIAGLIGGIALWVYILLFPAIVSSSSMLPNSLLDTGPFGLHFLSPHNLFWTEANDPIVLAAVWSLVVNLSLYIFVSLMKHAPEDERRQAFEFINSGRGGSHLRSLQSRHMIPLSEKVKTLKLALAPYLAESRIESIFERELERLGLVGKETVPVISISELQARVESILAGSVGSAVAHRAITSRPLFTLEEREHLRMEFSEILESMQVNPGDLRRKIDYFRERESLLSAHAQEQRKKLEELSIEISRRKEVQIALEESEEKYRQMIDHLHDGLFIIQDDDFVYYNRRFAEIHGYTASEEVHLSTLIDALDEESRNRSEEHIRLLENGELTNVEWSIRGLQKTREPFSGIVRLASIRYNGKPAAQGTLRDTTKQHELELQLNQAQKMEAVGRLAGGIAHDFNNLLTVMGGNAELAKLTLPSDSEVILFIEEILKSTAQAGSLTKQLLAFSRKQVINPVTIYVEETIHQVEKMLRRLIGEDVLLEIQTYPSPRPVWIDPTQMEQVLINLAVNARDAMPRGGTIVISTELVEFSGDDAVELGDLAPGEYVSIKVRDTGQGIPEGIGRQIFEPFFTTKEVGRGTGLGLATVYGIVKQNHGGIRYRSIVGEGTTFEIVLPPTTFKKESIDEGKTVKIDASIGEGIKVFVVEDAPSVRSYIVRVLEKAGFEVEYATNGQEAISMIEHSKQLPDLILTDIIMPELSGIEMVQSLSRLGHKMKAIYLSGYSDDELSRQGVNRQEIEYLEKPVSPEDLVTRIMRVLNIKQGSERPHNPPEID